MATADTITPSTRAEPGVPGIMLLIVYVTACSSLPYVPLVSKPESQPGRKPGNKPGSKPGSEPGSRSVVNQEVNQK